MQCVLTPPFLGKAIVTLDNFRFAIPRSVCSYAISNLEHIVVTCDYTRLRSLRPYPGAKVLDCGAGLGFYTTVSTYLGAYTIALEPLSTNIRFVELNLHMNNCRDKAMVLPLALSGDGRDLELYVGEYTLVSSAIPSHVKLHSDIIDVVICKSVPLSYILRRYGPFDIVKLDIEGLELEVLEEAYNYIPKYVRKLVIEVHTDVVDVNKVEDLLQSMGFTTITYTCYDMPYQVVVYALRI